MRPPLHARSYLLPLALIAIVFAANAPALAKPTPSGKPADVQGGLLSAKKIWGEAKHSGFPDLIRFQEQWYCVFREGEHHVGGAPGTIRVLVSSDGEQWESAATIAEHEIDLRDPKLSETPDGRLMLLFGGSIYQDATGNELRDVQSRVSFSPDGRSWTPPRKIVTNHTWLWRVTWHEGRAYGIVRVLDGSPKRGFLYSSADGLEWTKISELAVTGDETPTPRTGISETILGFTPDKNMIALCRPGYLGTSRPPYAEWKFQKVNAALYGPCFLQLPGDVLLASTRNAQAPTAAEKLASAKPFALRTVLAQITSDGDFRPVLTLPSGGDTGYSGLVLQTDIVWVAYHSGHEGNGIYLAKVKIKRP